MKLARDIKFSPYSLPACLPTLRLASTAGINVTVIGWGKLAEAGKLPGEFVFHFGVRQIGIVSRVIIVRWLLNLNRFSFLSFSLSFRNLETPRKTSLVVFDNAQCNDWLSSLQMRLLDNHLCAGVSKGGRDACQVDIYIHIIYIQLIFMYIHVYITRVICSGRFRWSINGIRRWSLCCCWSCINGIWLCKTENAWRLCSSFVVFAMDK